MKINEVEALTAIPKKTIRYYETEELLCPHRNRDNGYRSYTQEDVALLQQIKLLRKLGLSIAEIRSIQQGTLTLSDGLSRHRILLDRQIGSLNQCAALCRRMEEHSLTLQTLDGETWLKEMNDMEQNGTQFPNRQKADQKRSIQGAVLSAVVMVALMLAAIGVMLWGQSQEPLPIPLLLILLGIPAVCVVGVLFALNQRIKDLHQDELETSKKY